jgi:hypothetical protein
VSFDLVLFTDSDCPFGIFKIFSPGFKWFFFIIHLSTFGMYIKLAHALAAIFIFQSTQKNNKLYMCRGTDREFSRLVSFKKRFTAFRG